LLCYDSNPSVSLVDILCTVWYGASNAPIGKQLYI